MSNGPTSARPEPPELPKLRDDRPGFDEILDRLQKVVSKLEAGNLGLEDSLASYEEGVGLARQAHAVLDGAERRVELLVAAGASGQIREPLDRGGPASDDGPPTSSDH